jgi:hypothetical protein
MTSVREIFKLLKTEPEFRVVLLSNREGMGSGTVKVVRFSSSDIEVFDKYTRDVTYFDQNDPAIEILNIQRKNNYKKKGKED